MRSHEDCGERGLLRQSRSWNSDAVSSQLPRCQKAMQKACVDAFDSMNCRAAVNFCDNELSTAYWASGKPLFCVFVQESP